MPDDKLGSIINHLLVQAKRSIIGVNAVVGEDYRREFLGLIFACITAKSVRLQMYIVYNKRIRKTFVARSLS